MKKNILFFLTDDQRFDTIAALGNEQIKTPNIDKLVARGTVFTHAHIPGGTCGAVCMPSRAMIHSGRTLFHLDGEGQTIPAQHAMLGQCLKANGYQTYGIGKWHNGKEAFARSFTGGGEIFFGGMDDHWNVPVYNYDPTGKYDEQMPYCKDAFYSNKVDYKQCDHINAGKHSSELFADAAVDIIEKCDKTDPFFLYVSLMAPHDPRTMPEKFKAMYNEDDIELPANFAASHAIDTGALKIRDELLAAWPRQPQEIKRHIAEYYAMISHLDHEFGKVVEALVKAGLYEDTIIVFTGDNGLAVGKHGLMGKQNLYEHSVRIPLIFAGAGIPKGQTNDSLVYLLDIFPTLCDFAGIEIPASVEGKSLYPAILSGTNDNTRNSLYLAYADSIRGITNGKFKLIEYAAGNTQLFDLTADPDEMNNLAANVDFQNFLKTMRTSLLTLAKQWDDVEHPTGKSFWDKRKDLVN